MPQEHTKPDAAKGGGTREDAVVSTGGNQGDAVSQAAARKEDQPEENTAGAAAVVRTAAPARDVAGALNRFLTQYCRTYERRDLDRFMTFFSDNAVENATPFRELIPKYRKNFKKVAGIKYAIDMETYELDQRASDIRLDGRFSLAWQGIKDREWRKYHGDIQMALVAESNSFLIQQLNYRFDPH
jgi:hypothetical protein